MRFEKSQLAMPPQLCYMKQMSNVIHLEDADVLRVCNSISNRFCRRGGDFHQMQDLAEHAISKFFGEERGNTPDLSLCSDEEVASFHKLDQEAGLLLKHLRRSKGIGRKKTVYCLQLLRMYARTNVLAAEGVTDPLEQAVAESQELADMVANWERGGKLRL